MRKTIICLVGCSGSGKTYIAEYLEREHGVRMIQSRTTRPRRYPDENGHEFVSHEEFDTYPEEDMLAFTTFGGERYCCLIKDVTDDVMTYVIDERGLLYLKEHFSKEFNIFAIRIFAGEHERITRVGKERVDRDKGMFTLDTDHFDSFFYNEYDNDSTYRKIDTIYSRIKTTCHIQDK